MVHRNIDVLERAASELATVLNGFDGVIDINDGFADGKEQLDLVKPEARALDLLKQAWRDNFAHLSSEPKLFDNSDAMKYASMFVSRKKSADPSMISITSICGIRREIPLVEVANVSRGRVTHRSVVPDAGP